MDVRFSGLSGNGPEPTSDLSVENDPSQTLAAKIVVLQQTSAPNVIASACLVPREGSHETARIRYARRGRGSSVAAGGAGAARRPRAAHRRDHGGRRKRSGGED